MRSGCGSGSSGCCGRWSGSSVGAGRSAIPARDSGRPESASTTTGPSCQRLLLLDQRPGRAERPADAHRPERARRRRRAALPRRPRPAGDRRRATRPAGRQARTLGLPRPHALLRRTAVLRGGSRLPARLAPVLAAATRRSAAAARPATEASPPPAAGVIVLDSDLDLRASTAGARAWLAQLVPPTLPFAELAALAVVYNVASRALARAGSGPASRELPPAYGYAPPAAPGQSSRPICSTRSNAPSQ